VSSEQLSQDGFDGFTNFIDIAAGELLQDEPSSNTILGQVVLSRLKQKQNLVSQ